MFFLVGQLAIFYFSMYFMGIGMRELEKKEPREKGTFLDIKWYHFLWLYLPIMVFFHLFLKLTFNFYSSLAHVLKQFKILDFLFRGGGSHGTMSEEGSNSIVLILSFIGIFALYVFLMYVIWSLMKYLRQIAIGKTTQSLAVKILISAVLSIVIPVLLSFYYLV
jgi:uncharacterized membrane protein YidH (DUF202 family)